MPSVRKGGRGVVVVHLLHPQQLASHHERQSLLDFASRLAALKGYEPGGFHDPAARYSAPVYFVPSRTLTSAEAGGLGIRGPDDLFGGVVPQAFAATKLISHPLVGSQAAAVAGWNAELADQLAEVVLRGFSVFSRADAREAGRRLLASGSVRLKPARASGGHGQTVARDMADLQRLLDATDWDEVQAHGLVLEEHLDEPSTMSVGRVQVGELTASYFGLQKLTFNNQGEEVFGGSDLTVARGGFEALLPLRPSPEVLHAIEQARRYDAAVRSCFPGFYASRSNYDVLLGRDADGRRRSAVLEQSWRAGGATGPELAALEVFRAEPGREVVRTCGFEVFGPSPDPPAHAKVHFRGVDPEVGWLTKYTVVEPDGHSL